jgi:hypothetical protein
MITTPESSMALGGAMTVLAGARIIKSLYDRFRLYGRLDNSQQFWITIGLPGLLLVAGLVLIGIGVRDHYGQPLQNLWPIRTFWPQS